MIIIRSLWTSVPAGFGQEMKTTALSAYPSLESTAKIMLMSPIFNCGGYRNPAEEKLIWLIGDPWNEKENTIAMTCMKDLPPYTQISVSGENLEICVFVTTANDRFTLWQAREPRSNSSPDIDVCSKATMFSLYSEEKDTLKSSQI